MFFQELGQKFFKPVASRPPDYDSFDIRNHVRDAYDLLSDANQKGVQIPSDLIDVITEAREACTQARGASNFELPRDLEVRFWNAYGLLSSSIRPAERARRIYRNVFYVVIVVLLGSQFFFLSGDYARSKLAELDKQIIDVRGRAVTPPSPGTQQVSSSTAEAQIEQIVASQKAYTQLSRQLLAIVGSVVQLPFMIFGIQNFFLVDATNDVLVRGKLDMLLVFLSGFVLPMLYGLLGACAFVLRKLSDEIDKLTYANDARVRYSLRLNIGLLTGLAVGWFIKPGSGDATLISLSPLALAFIAGYGSDLFFVALDKIVQAFNPSSGSASKTIREVSSGGITTTTMRSSEAHVTGAEDPTKLPAKVTAGEVRASESEAAPKTRVA